MIAESSFLKRDDHMNYIEIKGGLGNQIFQYVFSKYIQAKTSECSVLHVGFFEYVKNIPGASVRSFDLDKFNTKYISVCGTIQCNRVVKEEEFRSDDILGSQSGETVFYRGYWQDKRFLEKAEERIMQDLTLKNEYINTDMSITAERMHMQESVSLHIRGTDYLQGVNRDIFASQDADYYRNALSVIRERCSGPIHIYVFTDDMDHANTILRDINEDEYEIMPQAESYQDLWLMSQTKHHIIANSSYSFWGARIGEEKEDKGYTVAPKLWFLRMKDPVLYPDDWIVM